MKEQLSDGASTGDRCFLHSMLQHGGKNQGTEYKTYFLLKHKMLKYILGQIVDFSMQQIWLSLKTFHPPLFPDSSPIQ